MKEASGELNMTVVTIVAIAAILGFFWAFWPRIQISIRDGWDTATTGGDNSHNIDGLDGYIIR